MRQCTSLPMPMASFDAWVSTRKISGPIPWISYVPLLGRNGQLAHSRHTAHRGQCGWFNCQADAIHATDVATCKSCLARPPRNRICADRVSRGILRIEYDSMIPSSERRHLRTAQGDLRSS